MTRSPFVGMRSKKGVLFYLVSDRLEKDGVTLVQDAGFEEWLQCLSVDDASD